MSDRQPALSVKGHRLRCEQPLYDPDDRSVRVWRGAALDPQGQATPAVIKHIAGPLSSDQRLRLDQELQVGLALDTERIARPLAACSGPASDGGFVLCFPANDGAVSLDDWLRVTHSPAARLRMARRVGLDLLDALDVLHGAGWIHRDLKDPNVLVHPDPEAPRTQLIDLGSVRRASDAHGLQTRQPGAHITPLFAPPEAHEDPVDPGIYQPAFDLYSLGATLWRVLLGDVVRADGHRIVYDGDLRARFQAFHGEPWPAAFEGLAQCVTACGSKDPAARPRIDEARNLLNSAANEPLLPTGAAPPPPPPAPAAVSAPALAPAPTPEPQAPARSRPRSARGALLALLAILATGLALALALKAWLDPSHPAPHPTRTVTPPSVVEPTPRPVPSRPTRPVVTPTSVVEPTPRPVPSRPTRPEMTPTSTVPSAPAPVDSRQPTEPAPTDTPTKPVVAPAPRAARPPARPKPQPVASAPPAPAAGPPPSLAPVPTPRTAAERLDELLRARKQPTGSAAERLDALRGTP